jgi:hypothetical protein
MRTPTINETARFNYGWVIVGAGLIMTCVAMGAMFSLRCSNPRSRRAWAGPMPAFPAP